MAEAILESMQGFPEASPNPSVGCIIVKNNIEISRGHTEAFGGLHAEIKAISKVDQSQLAGACLYVTLAPCTHQGKQPPCTDALLKLGLKRLVIAMIDPNPLVSSQSIGRFTAAGVDVKLGVLEREARATNFSFCHSVSTGKLPFILKWAQSIDGALADDTGKSKWISGDLSRLYNHFLRLKYDAILVGANTVVYDTPSLLSTHPLSTPKNQPIRVVFDPKSVLSSQLPLDLKNSILDKTFCQGAKTILLTSKKRDSFTEVIESKGHFVLTLDESDAIGSLEGVLSSNAVTQFVQKPLGSVIVEGGANLLSSLIKENLFHAGHTFIAPIFLGGKHRILSHSTKVLMVQNFMSTLQIFNLKQDAVFEWLQRN
jgi:diaminohydroxyphosphoribosylaminopyrimidine deaminase/5-amino-6-(5-phosphoribosylamino)uracil reductase